MPKRKRGEEIVGLAGIRRSFAIIMVLFVILMLSGFMTLASQSFK